MDPAELWRAYGLEDRATPRVRVNFVSSADGSVSLGGRSGTLGGPTDRAVMQVLRAMSDVILVGAGTVRTEGYGAVQAPEESVRWRREQGLDALPRIAVVSESLHLTPGDPVFTQPSGRALVITCAAAPSDRREALGAVADVLVCGAASVDLPSAVRELTARGMPQILCEGGPHLFGSLAEAGLVDELCLTLAPVVAAGSAGRITHGGAEGDRRYRLGSILHDNDGYVFLRYTR